MHMSNEETNEYVNIFINNYVKTFRNDNYDEFAITIYGIKEFIDTNDNVFSSLIELLRINKFSIYFDGCDESLSTIDVKCENKSNKTIQCFKYHIQSLPLIVDLSSKTDISIYGLIIMNIVSQLISKLKIMYKVIVLDLDDTLWKGTLSEDGLGEIIKNMMSEQGLPFISFMKFIKNIAKELGIYLAICSKNNIEDVTIAIDNMTDCVFPLKNQLDYIVANYNDKSENIKEIASKLSVLPSSIVFIDDNKIVRDEVRRKMPNVFVPEWINHYELITQIIIGCFFNRIEISRNSQNRKRQFRIIQTERRKNSLPSLLIKSHKDRDSYEAKKLYAKSNQFKFVQKQEMSNDIKSEYFEIFRENGESIGICSAVSYIAKNDSVFITNWAISCRYFGIGLEEYIFLYINKLSLGKDVYIKCQQSDTNKKVSEFIGKYPNLFVKNNQDDVMRIDFTESTIDNIKSNTNLREVI